MTTKENSIAQFVKQQIRKSYNADISDPKNYDLTINTGRMSIESAVEAVIAPVKSS
jgi:cytidylate kinase